MAVLTFIGRVFVVLALAALALGLGLWLSGAEITRPAGELWFALDSGSLNGLQVLIQRHLRLPDLWDGGIVPLLNRPAWEAILWLVIGGLVIGGLFLLGGRRRKPRKPTFKT